MGVWRSGGWRGLHNICLLPLGLGAVALVVMLVAQVKLMKCLVDSVVVDISFNHIEHIIM